MTRQAPEIYQKAIEDLDLAGLPARGTEGFDQALIAHFALDYAARGWNVLVTVDEQYVRVVAVPVHGIEPKTYVVKLLKHGFLGDALPLLEALSGMLDDAEVEYNTAICRSELGRIEESVATLERCLALEPAFVSALVGLCVAYVHLGRLDEAETALRDAIQHAPENAFAKRNLAVVLSKSKKLPDIFPFLRQPASLTPQDSNVQLGLAQCLMRLVGTFRADADKIYKQNSERCRDQLAADVAVVAPNRCANEKSPAAVDGIVRIDVVFYMQHAMEEFAKENRAESDESTMEIVLLGQKGLPIINPDVRYNLERKPGEYSGLQLVSMMHVGIKLPDPYADTRTGLDREYALASRLKN